MKPKFICDNCGEELKTQMQEEDMTIYIIPNKLDGFSVMEHHNCHNYIVLCELCEEQAREELKENEDWSSLEQWDMFGEVKDFYNDFPKLKEHIEKLSKEKKALFY
jgi:hypothetical protein